MALLKRESSYERKIRELDEEAERVRKNMQQLMKQVPREGAPVRSATPGKPSIRRTAVPSHRASPEYAPPYDDDSGAQAGDDFSPASTDASSSGSSAGRPPHPGQFASYLASGSFGEPRALMRERRVQRNKAIMMLIFALLALYSLYMWMN